MSLADILGVSGAEIRHTAIRHDRTRMDHGDRRDVRVRGIKWPRYGHVGRGCVFIPSRANYDEKNRLISALINGRR
jgi:hypothetical protein